MRLVMMSDTHGVNLARWDIPDGDVLIHTGDFTRGRGLRDVEALREQFDKLPHRVKLLVGGNHDNILQEKPEEARAILDAYRIPKEKKRGVVDPLAELDDDERRLLKPIYYLEDEAVIIDGVKFFGTPWQPDFLRMAFNLPRGSGELHQKRLLIPDDVEVLLTHCPPAEILDWLNQTGPLGCNQLRWRVDNLRHLKLHCFGHIHEGYGMMSNEKTTFVNAASLNSTHRKLNPPVVLDL